MKKLRCIIVDDEPIARKILHEFVEHIPFLDLQGKFENAEKAAAFLCRNTIDIILLDIEMPKVSGLQLLQKMHIESLVIVTTAFPQKPSGRAPAFGDYSRLQRMALRYPPLQSKICGKVVPLA